jgi:hypothetical protein
MRDFLINLAAGLITALLLYGLSQALPLVRSSPGPYLDVDMRAEEFGSASVITITAHNAAQVGVAPLRANLRAQSGLLAALVRSPNGNGAVPVTADSIQWTGDLGVGESVALILVVNGGSLIGDSRQWFTGTYRMVDSRGFAKETPLLVRPASEARLERIGTVAKIAGWVAGVGVVIGLGIFLYRHSRRSRATAS